MQTGLIIDVNEQYEEPSVNWKHLIQVFEDRISHFEIRNEMDMIRRSVSEKCRDASERETGIYQLSVPTGGGKTFSSFRFALHHAQRKGKKRIIYVIPYLSIIDQTARNLREILGLSDDDSVIFEHHSNIMEPEDEKAADIRKLITAMVGQPDYYYHYGAVLETVMSAKSGKLRKFHSILTQSLFLMRFNRFLLKQYIALMRL